MTRKAKIGCGCLFLPVVLFLIAVVFSYPSGIISMLLFGWIAFIIRLLPDAIQNWNWIIFTLLCLIGFVGAAHWFCSWLYDSVQQAKQVEETPQRHWKFGWTATLSSIIFLLIP